MVSKTENCRRNLEIIDGFVNYRGSEGRALYDSVQRYVLKKLKGDKFSSDDVMSEIQIKVWKSMEQYDAFRSSSSWIFAIASNAIIDYKRRNKRILTGIEVDYDSEDKSLSPLEIIKKQEEKEIVRKSLESLPEISRIPIELVYFNGLKYKDVAEILNIPCSTVKSRVKKGISGLRGLLSKTMAAA